MKAGNFKKDKNLEYFLITKSTPTDQSSFGTKFLELVQCGLRQLWQHRQQRQKPSKKEVQGQNSPRLLYYITIYYMYFFYYVHNAEGK